VPADPVGTILLRDGKRGYERLRWGLVPYWWSKPLKELRLATFNARAETVDTKPFFREAFKRRRCLIPVSSYYEWQYRDGPKKPPQPWYFTPAGSAQSRPGQHRLQRSAGPRDLRNLRPP